MFRVDGTQGPWVTRVEIMSLQRGFVSETSRLGCLQTTERACVSALSWGGRISGESFSSPYLRPRE